MQRSEAVALAKETFAEIKDDDIVSLASGVAFRMFLSLFPGLIAAVAIYSIVSDPSELTRLLDSAEQVLPQALVGEEQGILRRELVNLTSGERGAGGLALAGVAGGVWAATSAAVAVMKALNRAYEVEEKRKFLPARLTALALTTALFLALVALVLLLVAGKPVQDLLLPAQLEDGPLAVLLAFARVLAAIAVLMLLFAFVYWAAPNRERPEWQWITPGAVLGVVGWLAISGGFALYTRLAGNFNATYGALAAVVVVLLWLQLSMLALLAGGELNSVIELRRFARQRAHDGEGFGGVAAMEGAPPPSAAVTLPARPATVSPVERPLRMNGARIGQASAAHAAAVAAVVMAGLVLIGLARRGRRAR